MRWYLVANIPLVVAIFLLPHYHLFLWGSLGISASLAVFVGAAKNRPAHRRAWLAIAISLATFVSGDISYDVLTRFLHESNCFVPVAPGGNTAVQIGRVSRVTGFCRFQND